MSCPLRLVDDEVRDAVAAILLPAPRAEAPAPQPEPQPESLTAPAFSPEAVGATLPPGLALPAGTRQVVLAPAR